MSPTTPKGSLSRNLDNVMMVLGFWLLMSPGFLGFSSTSPDNWIAACSGAALVALIIVSRVAFRIWEEWLVVLFGASFVALPWIAGFAAGPASEINLIASGVAVMVLAGWRIADHSRRPREPMAAA